MVLPFLFSLYGYFGALGYMDILIFSAGAVWLCLETILDIITGGRGKNTTTGI